MFIHYRTQGLVIKKEERLDADEFLTIYTKDFGKIEVLAKAIKKISSKLRSGADIFHLSEIEFIQGKTYKILTDALLIEKFANIRKDLERLRLACGISRIIDGLVNGQELDSKIWQLLEETFKKLNSLNLKSEIIYYYFLWNCFLISGYGPEIYSCVVCRKKLSPLGLYSSPREGGIVCKMCSDFAKDKTEVSPEIVKILRIILKKDWDTISNLKLTPFYRQSLKDVSDNYLDCVLRENR